MFDFLKCFFHIHKWKYVYEVFDGIFLGEYNPQFVKKFRICEKCGVAQRREMLYEGVFWDTLSVTEIKLLKKKIKDKGNYYIILNKFD